MAPDTRYRCSGDGPGYHEPCAFTTDSLTEAMDHFEATGGHNVDDTAVCSMVASSGNDCDLQPRYSLTAEDGHTTFACETHRDTAVLRTLDYVETLYVARINN